MMRVQCLVFALLAGLALAQFHYDDSAPGNGPSSWSSLNGAQACAGGPSSRQSPIDIIAGAASVNQLYGDINFDYRDEDDAELFNSAENLQMVTTNTHRVHISGICGGQGTARLVRMQFHWGQDDDEGSEHLLEGEASPMELQMVHVCSQYASVDDAIQSNDPEALVIISALFDIDVNDQPPAFDVMQPYLEDVQEEFSTVTLPKDVPLNKIFEDNEPYYTYQGSLTAPGCNQVARWFVLHFRQNVQPDFIEGIRNVRLLVSGSDTFAKGRNWRPTQDKNGREVLRSFENRPVPASKTWFYSESAGTRSASACAVVAAAVACSVALVFF